MSNWHAIPDNQRTVELRLCIVTNMNAAEIGGLMDGLCISITEFGKEHLDPSRYENVHLRVTDPCGFRAVS